MSDGNFFPVTSSNHPPPMMFYNIVFMLSNNFGSGTGFVVTYDDKKYMITAKHVVPDADAVSKTIVVGRDSPNPYDFGLRWVGSGGGDISVLYISNDKVFRGPVVKIPKLDRPVYLGADVFFLGYPDSKINLLEGQRGKVWPYPLCHKGIISGVVDDPHRSYYIHGIGLPGVSGGPLLHFAEDSPGRFDVIGVMSYMSGPLALILDAKTLETMKFRCITNGFSGAVGIQFVPDIIRNNANLWSAE